MDKIPMKRIGEPEDIVGAAIFLTSGASDLITGQILLIDAGYSLP
jgi:NAD(P)-dependent dehydrogenase (short-subunit alcohol dehydrogenase family)